MLLYVCTMVDADNGRLYYRWTHSGRMASHPAKTNTHQSEGLASLDTGSSSTHWVPGCGHWEGGAHALMRALRIPGRYRTRTQDSIGVRCYVCMPTTADTHTSEYVLLPDLSDALELHRTTLYGTTGTGTGPVPVSQNRYRPRDRNRRCTKVRT